MTEEAKEGRGRRKECEALKSWTTFVRAGSSLCGKSVLGPLEVERRATVGKRAVREKVAVGDKQ